MTKKQKKMLRRIIIAAVLFFPLLILQKTGQLDALLAGMSGGTAGMDVFRAIAAGALFAVPYLIVGYDILLGALKNIRHGNVFDEKFLMMVATIAAFCIGEYPEACAVMLFYQIGELFQSYAVGKSRQSIADMMSIAPEFANLETDGDVEEVDPDEVDVGSVIVIRPGERIPLDGVVLEGESFLDTAALTGESVPRRAHPGDTVISGCVNGEGTLRVRTTKAYEDSTVAKILELVETASEKKARLENFITRFARWYTPCVTLAAVILALVPPLVLGQPFGGWIHRACIFLIVSCPCALVISVPLGFFGGIGAASKIGVLVKGSNYLESIAEMDTIVFDKTGTLTKGEFTVTAVHPAEGSGLTEQELLELAAHGEGYSTHPIARSIHTAYGKDLDHSRIGEAHETAGHGIRVMVDGKEMLLGNTALMLDHNILVGLSKDPGTIIYTARDGQFLGSIVISDTVKEGAADAVRSMKSVGVTKAVMLTGDRKEAAEAVAAEIGIDEVAKVEELLAAGDAHHRVGFVGDGSNDAPVLMRADVGIAMGSLGSDAAIEAADIVLMDDDIRKIASVVRIARKTLRIVKENVGFALVLPQERKAGGPGARRPRHGQHVGRGFR